MKKKTAQIMGSAVALLLAAAGTVQAVNVYWTGAALDGEWGNSNNWDTMTVPVGGDYVYVADPSLTDTVVYHDGDTNVVSRHFFYGGMTFNMTGGILTDATSGNTVRTFVGNAGSSATLNLSGGQYNIGHQLRIGIGSTGSDGVVNLDGGNLTISRGSYSAFHGNGVSISLAIGQQNGVLNLLNGTLATRVGVEVGGNGTFNVQGTGATISIGGNGGDGDGSWYQSSGSILRFGIASDGVSTIVINDDAAAAGVPTVLFDAGALLDVSFVGSPINGTWTLLEVENGDIMDNGLAFAPGVDTSVWSFAIDNSGANGILTVTATAVAELHWNGAPNGDWDIGTTANWLDGASAATYSDGAEVTFNDNLTGTSTVNLTTTLSPAAIVVTNSATNYTFSGTGNLSGSTGLTKDGAGALTLGNSGGNDFTGPVQLNAGTLTLADAGALGATDSRLDVNGGTLDLGGFSVTKGAVNIAGGTINNGTLTGSGFAASSGTVNAALAGASASLTKSSSSTLVLAGNNTYDGSTTINDGTVQLGSATALGSTTGTTAFNAGTLDLNGQTIGESFTAINGTFVNSNTTTAAQITAELVGLGYSTFDGPGDIIVSNIRRTDGVTRRITKNGSGTLTLGGDQSNNRYGLTVNAGNVNLAKTSGEAVSRFALIMNNASSTVTLQNKGSQIGDQTDLNGLHEINAGTLNLNGFSEELAALTTTTGAEPGGIVTNSNGSSTSTLTLLGVVGTDATWPGTIAGNLALIKTGANTQTLSGANTYTGDTTINSGILALSGSGSLASPSIAVAAGAAFDVSGVSGGSFALNGSGALTLNVNKSGGTSQGQVVIGDNNLTYGGTLTVNASGDALADGDSFTLVPTNGTPGQLTGWFSSVTLTDPGTGLSWDTNQLATAGVLEVYTFTTTPLVMSTPKNAAAVVSAGKLAKHASSARGTPVALSASAPSHGAASISAGSLTYIPAADYVGSDSFTVTFADGHGIQTMAVDVTVGTASSGGQSPNVLISGTDGSGNFYALFVGAPNTSYTVETNSVASGGAWVKYGDITSGSDGLINVTNVPPVDGSLFFRTVYPAY